MTNAVAVILCVCACVVDLSFAASNSQLVETLVLKHFHRSAQSITIYSPKPTLPSCSCWDSINSHTLHTHTLTYAGDFTLITPPDEGPQRPWTSATNMGLDASPVNSPCTDCSHIDWERKCCRLLALADRCGLMGVNGIAIVRLPAGEIPKGTVYRDCSPDTGSDLSASSKQ